MNLKEMKMLVKMKTAMGESVDQSILDQIAVEEARIAAEQEKEATIIEERKSAFGAIFNDLAKDIGKLMEEDKKRTAEQQDAVDRFASLLQTMSTKQPQIVEEKTSPDPEIVEKLEVIVEKTAPQPEPKEKTLVEAAVSKVSKTTAPSMFVQPEPPLVDRDIKAIQQKLKLLEGWVSKISASGPGGGEVNFRYLDDVARSTMTPSNDNWVLEYDATTKKVQFTEHIGPIRSAKFNTTGPQTALVPGQIAWNEDEDCLDIRHTDGTTLQTGLEQHLRVHNHNAETMVNGTVVMFAGVENTNSIAMPIIGKYVADANASPLFLIGVLTSDIVSGGIGRATTFGYVRNLNTTGADVGETWVQGNLLWGHPTMPGKMTNVRPSAPYVSTSIAAVARVSATDGQLLVRPTIWPRLWYGDWYDTTNQTAASINTAYAVKMNSVNAVSGFELNAGGTVIKALNAGRYNFQFSLQFTSSNSASSKVYIWYRKNGVDVPHSTTVLTIASNGGKLAPAWNFPVLMSANDTFTLMWAVDSTSVSLSAEPATAFCPSVPSVILSVSQTNL